MSAAHGHYSVPQQSYCQQRDDGHQQQVHLLVPVLQQIPVHPVVQRRKPFVLRAHLLCLHQHHLRVLVRHQGRLQQVLLVVGLPLQDTHGQLHQQVAARGIDIRGRQHPVHHLLNAAVLCRQRINAHEYHFLLQSALLRSLVGTNRHAVVLSEHAHNVLPLLQHRVHQAVSALLRPVAVARQQAVLVGKALHETLMALLSRRRALQALYLQHHSAAPLPVDELSNHAAHLQVVGTHEGRIFLRVRLAVEQNYRNALVVGPVNGRRDGVHLVWRHNQQVHVLVYEMVYLTDLHLVVVVGRCKFQFRVVVEVSAHHQFLVLFLAPDVLAALRDAYAVHLPFRTRNECDCQEQQAYIFHL